MRIWPRGVCAVALVVAAVSMMFAIGLTNPASASVPRTTSVSDWVTFYGWVDNTPPSGQIAHPCIHATAGGSGTYSDPVTFAEPIDLKGPWCQIVYVPFLRKYFIHEDQCDPCGGVNTNHIDLWMGGDKNSRHQPERRALLACEDRWTRDARILLNPSATEPVDKRPLFTPPTTCRGRN